MSTVFRVGVCGTTHHTRTCLEALAADPRFSIAWVVTPPPKPVGRKQVLTATPVERWAHTHDVPVLPAHPKLAGLRDALEHHAAIDFLLVVDFGYLIPPWLLTLPRVAPVNVHPSDLPKYRGSAPGQYVLLYGETTSAVCVMLMDESFDTGDVLCRVPFAVASRETQSGYYHLAFRLVTPILADTLAEYAANRQSKPQPATSPTPLAVRFEREDGFIPYPLLRAAQEGATAPMHSSDIAAVLRHVAETQALTPAVLLDRATRALTPWPGIWTMAPEHKGRRDVRLKILDTELTDGRLRIRKYQFAGEQPQQGTPPAP